MKALFSRLLLAGLGLGLVFGVGSCGPAKEKAGGPPRHVFLITVDTLRADHLGVYGYPRDTSPRLAELAQDGVLFERAIAQWPKTGPSFASMFTGQYPQTTGLTHKAAIRIPEGYLTLPELMRELGFTTAAVVSNGVLGKRLEWDRGFGEYLQTWDLADEATDDPVKYRETIHAGRVNELALPLLERLRGEDRLFVWLHYSDPHAPYILTGFENPFLGDAYYVGEEEAQLAESESAAIGDHRDLKYYVAQYDANVLFTDLRIGEVLQRARELGLLEDALIVFTADHGESLGEHDYFFGHGRLPHNPGAHVPLIVSYPGGGIDGGRRVDRPVALVDLYPTLRDLLAPGKEVPGLEGRTLLPLLRPAPGAAGDDAAKRFRYAFSEAGGGSPLTHYRSVQEEGWKLVYHPPLQGRKQLRPESWELYHLAEDPAELHNLAEQNLEERQRLAGVLEAWMKGSQWIRKPQAEIEAHSEETLKALKALGYVD